jgi:hypothetical protein
MPKKLSDFVAAHTRDKSPQIRAYLRKLGNRYVDQLELCRATGVANQDLHRYHERFVAHLVPTRNAANRKTFLWAGTPKLAKQMCEVTRA